MTLKNAVTKIPDDGCHHLGFQKNVAIYLFTIKPCMPGQVWWKCADLEQISDVEKMHSDQNSR